MFQHLRLKNHRLVHGNNPDAEGTDSVDADHDNNAMIHQIPAEIDSITTQPNSHMCWREGRQLLRKYDPVFYYSVRWVYKFRT